MGNCMQKKSRVVLEFDNVKNISQEYIREDDDDTQCDNKEWQFRQPSFLQHVRMNRFSSNAPPPSGNSSSIAQSN